MTINIHNNHNKLSIVGDANWQVGTVGADLAGGASAFRQFGHAKT